MKPKLHTEWTIADICDGFVYNELGAKGLFGMGGRLTIQPEYQRNYIYADGKRDVAVILIRSKNSKSYVRKRKNRALEKNT